MQDFKMFFLNLQVIEDKVVPIDYPQINKQLENILKREIKFYWNYDVSFPERFKVYKQPEIRTYLDNDHG